MPISHYIRSYPSFPSVIPIHTASSLRVTHPSAMIPLPEGSLLIDLHVLSILSAFILSQDQTLHSIFIYFTLPYFFFFLTWRLFLLLLFSLSFLTHSFLLLTRNILPNLINFVNAFFYLFLLFFCLFFLSSYFFFFLLSWCYSFSFRSSTFVSAGFLSSVQPINNKDAAANDNNTFFILNLFM